MDQKIINAVEAVCSATSSKSAFEIMMRDNEAFRNLMQTNSSFKNAVEDIKKMKEYLSAHPDKKKAISNLNAAVQRQKKATDFPDRQEKAPSKQNIATRDYKKDIEMIDSIIGKDKSMNIDIQKKEVFNSVTSSASSGGYLIPEELHDQIVQAMYAAGTIMGIADVINIKTQSLTIPIAATISTAEWISDGGIFPDTSPSVGRIKLNPHKAGAVTKVSEELFEDCGFDVEAYISSDAGTQLGRIMEFEFINGTLTGRPTGILKSAQFALTSSVTNSFNYSDILNLFTAVKEPYRKNGSWLISDDANTLKTIINLKDDSGNRILTPSTEQGILGTVFGRPVKISEAMPAITTSAKGVLFGDFGYYKIGIKDMSVVELLELYSDHGQVGYKTYIFADGELSIPEAVKYLACL